MALNGVTCEVITALYDVNCEAIMALYDVNCEAIMALNVTCETIVVVVVVDVVGQTLGPFPAKRWPTTVCAHLNCARH